MIKSSPKRCFASMQLYFSDIQTASRVIIALVFCAISLEWPLFLSYAMWSRIWWFEAMYIARKCGKRGFGQEPGNLKTCFGMYNSGYTEV